MRLHAAMLAACLLLAAGCAGSSTAALDYDTAVATINENIRIIVAGINSEDVFLASQPVGDQFTMDNNVSTRYAGDWSGVGIGPFRNFWDAVFTGNANIEFSISVTEMTQTGDLMSVLCTTDYTAQLADVVPPDTRVSTNSDELQFERINGQWLLRRWEAVAEGEPVGEGGA